MREDSWQGILGGPRGAGPLCSTLVSPIPSGFLHGCPEPPGATWSNSPPSTAGQTEHHSWELGEADCHMPAGRPCRLLTLSSRTYEIKGSNFTKSLPATKYNLCVEGWKTTGMQVPADLLSGWRRDRQDTTGLSIPVWWTLAHVLSFNQKMFPTHTAHKWFI